MGGVISILIFILHIPLTIHDHLVSTLALFGGCVTSLFWIFLVPFSRGKEEFAHWREVRAERIFMAQLEKEWAKNYYYYDENESD
jgi:hypothetical protein